MSSQTIVTDTPAGALELDTLDPSSLFRPAFPSADLVRAAAGLLTPVAGWTGLEGPRARVIVAPGVLTVARRDPARLERSAERAVRATRVAVDQEAQALLEGRTSPTGVREGITVWSRKSRANMVKVLASLDYAPLFAGGGLPAMLTLTYPGDWETVAPDPGTCKRHVDTLKKRFARAYGRPLVGVWKREWQRRGAPHYHILMVPPTELVAGQTFRAWISATWASIVAHPDPEEYRRHTLAGTGLDYAEGMRGSDPKRLAIYFGKHGAYAAKDYQNDAPELWRSTGSVGRFWGVWGLSKAQAVVEVTEEEAHALTRTMRRHARANGYSAPREVWRAIHTVDVETGEIGPYRWKRRRVNRRVRRMRGNAGFVTLNDAPAFVSQVARYLDQVRPPARAAGTPASTSFRSSWEASRPLEPASVTLF